MPVTAAVPLSTEDWFEFGRSIGDPCTGGTSAVTVRGAQHTISFVLPPETDDPAEVAMALVGSAGQRRAYSRFAIRVAAAPFTERFNRGT